MDNCLDVELNRITVLSALYFRNEKWDTYQLTPVRMCERGVRAYLCRSYHMTGSVTKKQYGNMSICHNLSTPEARCYRLFVASRDSCYAKSCKWSGLRQKRWFLCLGSKVHTQMQFCVIRSMIPQSPSTILAYSSIKLIRTNGY